MNNPAAQGEWDNELLQEIKLSYPDIDFQKDLAFDMLDMQYILPVQASLMMKTIPFLTPRRNRKI